MRGSGYGDPCILDMETIWKSLVSFINSLCCLVVRVLGYRSGGPGSIPGNTRFSVKKKNRKKEKQ
jgi:hypothetical protein